MNKKKFKKSAFVLSVCLLILWALLGTGATVAWFTDTTPTVKNTFDIGEMNLTVYYKNDVVTEYTLLDDEKSIFNDEALYEPGYTQVVYLKIVNDGEIDFDYKISVNMIDYTKSVNVYGADLHLPQFLKYGVVFGAGEADLNRKLAQGIATEDMRTLNMYSKLDDITVAVGEERYAALVVFMPEEVGNQANYMLGKPVPTVELGITVFAQQAGAPME